MIRKRAVRTLLGTVLVPLLVAALPRSAHAQADLGHLDDATVAPQGRFRVQISSAWTRFDSRFAPADSTSRTIPLGAEYSFDSLGVAQLPALAPTQSAISSLTGSPFHLTLGRTAAAADARISVTPVDIEYGLTRRLTIGVMVPLVRTRTTISLKVNPLGTEGNVGINPAKVNPGALASDSMVVAQLVSAGATLASTLEACQANASANANCPTILQRQADVTALLQSATAFANAFGAVYGANAQSSGALVVPLAGTVADQLIRTRLASYDSSFQAYLNAGAVITAAPAAAGGVVGTQDLGTLLQNPAVAGFDSLKSTVRISTGDVELSAKFQLFDDFTDSVKASRPGAVLARATFTGTLRLPTGQLATPTNPLDIGTGLGTMAADGRLAWDMQAGGRIGLSAAAEYLHPFGKTKSGALPIGDGAPFPPSTSDAYPYTPGAVTRVEVAPRFMIAPRLGISALYDFVHVAANDYGSVAAGQVAAAVATLDGVTSAAGTQQAAGFGLTYSTVPEYDRGRVGFPVDITYTHLEALSGAARMPRYWRDQISVRFYFRRGAL